MYLTATVGFPGKNNNSDVKLVQTLFNLNRSLFPDATPRRLTVDGLIGRKTVDAIKRFQSEIMGARRPHPVVAEHDATARKMEEAMDDSFSKEKLAAIMPLASSTLITRYFRPLEKTMANRGITTALRRAHFLAQLAHESGSLRFAEELASGAAYEGRKDLGNTERGDGRRFKGRGLIQLTGRANYQQYSDATGIDYVRQPKLLAEDPDVAADVAGWFWSNRGLDTQADRDDVTSVTKIINGGYNGLEDRVDALRRARCLFGAG